MYQPGETAKILDLPGSTLRHYAVTYKDFLSPGARGRRRSYTDKDLATLEKVRSLSDSGLGINEIMQVLGEDQENVIDETEEVQPTSSLAVLPTMLFQMNDTLTQIHDDQQALRDEVKALRQELKETRRPVWERIFKRGKD